MIDEEKEVGRWASYETKVDKAIEGGLARGDAAILKLVLEQQEKEKGEKTLSNLRIEITPYTVKDSSLREIVLKAPEYILDEIIDALRERRRLSNGEVLVEIE